MFGIEPKKLQSGNTGFRPLLPLEAVKWPFPAFGH